MAKKKVGRPALYTDPKKLQTKIDEYFDQLEHFNPDGTFAYLDPATFTGLAYCLGFASRQSLWEYSNKDGDISLPVKRAMLRIEAEYEKALRQQACTGSIFALKNRGWVDKQEVKTTSEVSIIDVLNEAHEQNEKE